jgi:uridine kinase
MKAVLNQRLFWLGLLMRLGLAPFFGSHYLTDLFIPFIDHAILNPGTNPWDALPEAHFPYGAFLFLVLWLPKVALFQLFGKIVLGAGALGLFISKLPLLGVELLLIRAMIGTGLNVRRVLNYYWLSPIALFVSYVHGQLDIVMVTCVYLSFTWLKTRQIGLSSLAMACALGSKFSAALMIPVGLAYIWHREFAPKSWRDASLWLVLSLSLALIFFTPVLMAEKLGYATFGSPEAMRLLAARITLGQNSDLYIGPALVVGALFWLCLGSRMTGEGLLLAGGFLFGILLLTTQAMPGWYIWALPMLALLYIRYPTTPTLPWHAFNAIYIGYFTGLLGALMERTGSQTPWEQIFFTLLQTNLALLIGMVWYVALRLEARPESLVKPLVIGIAGDSGVGKDRLSKTLVDCFSARDTAIMHGDDYHKWERGDFRYQEVTHLNPGANHLKIMGTHTKSLIYGKMVMVRHYDHDSGRFAAPHELTSKKTLIVQGLHALYLRGMRRNLDLRVFLAPDESLQVAWKIRRDVKERGADLKTVLRSIEKRKADAVTHIAPQRHYADWIIEAIPKAGPSVEQMVGGMLPAFYVRHIVWNDVDLEPLAVALQKIPGVTVKVESLSQDLNRTVLTIDGDFSKQHICTIAESLFPDLRYITRSSRPPLWHPGYDGIAQVLALTLLQERLEQRHEDISHDVYQTPSQSHRGPQHFETSVGS